MKNYNNIKELTSAIQKKAFQLERSENIATDNNTKFSINCAISIRKSLNELALQLVKMTT